MTLIDEDIDLEALLGDADPPCLACCKGNVTFCGKPYHPETTIRVGDAVYQDGDVEACPSCEEVGAEYVCDDGGRAPLHLHCPFREGNPVCAVEA